MRDNSTALRIKSIVSIVLCTEAYIRKIKCLRYIKSIRLCIMFAGQIVFVFRVKG